MWVRNIITSVRRAEDAVREGMADGTLPADVWTEATDDRKHVRYFSNDGAACEAINAALEEAGCDIEEVGWREVEPILTVAQVAERLNKPVQTVYTWLAAGLFPGAWQTRPDNPHRGEWKVPAGALDGFVAPTLGRPVK